VFIKSAGEPAFWQTLLLVLLNYRLVRETQRMREVGTEPKLEVYLVPHEAYVTITHMVVRNSGGGPATQITWNVTEDAAGVQERGIAIQGMALFHVLHYLPAKEGMRFFFGETVKLLKEPGMKPIEISVSFRNQTGKNEQRDTFIIDVKPWSGMSMVGKPPLYEMAESLKKMQKDFQQIASGFPTPLVRTQPESEYREEQNKIRGDAMAEQKRSQEK
jgi:hypothetical protein